MPPPPETPPRESLLAFLPKGTLYKVVSLLLLLAAVIFLRCRSDLLVGAITAPAPLPAARSRNAPVGTTDSGASGRTVPSSAR